MKCCGEIIEIEDLVSFCLGVLPEIYGHRDLRRSNTTVNGKDSPPTLTPWRYHFLLCFNIFPVLF
jgi:hypothetical protein